jgi:ABC-type ATPase involved in cell division
MKIHLTAVHPLDFELECGKMLEITGHSNGGKRTLLKTKLRSLRI